MGIDLNADLGEGFGAWTLGDDTALLEVITSANVACGFHAGDPLIMHRVTISAAERGVVVGAQVGYRDLAGFGRRAIDVATPDLFADIVYQLGALEAFARVADDHVRYVKPHGALYNTAMTDERQADAIVAAVAAFNPALPLLGLPESALAAAAAQRSVPYVNEGFADRAYTADGRLVPRSEPGAVITDTDAVVAQALTLARDGAVQSICLHGDTPGAAELARQVRAALTDAGVELRSFA